MMNKNIKEKINNNNSKSKVKFPDVKSEGILQINEKSNEKDLKKKPHGFYPKMSSEELIECAKSYCREHKITKRTALAKKNKTLYNELCKRKLVDLIFDPIKTKPRDFYSKMNDGELILFAKKYCEENKILTRTKLNNTYSGLYFVLKKRGLFDSVGLNKTLGDWISMSDKELIEYSKDFCMKQNLHGRKKLRGKSEKLYHVLYRRKLLDSVFSGQSHLDDLVDAIRNFGAEVDDN